MKLFSVLSAAACLTSLVAAQTTVFSEDFSDNSAGWTMDPGWQIGAAAASSGHSYGGPDPASDADGTLGGGVAGVYLGGNSTGAAHSHRYFVSPTIPVGSLASAQLTFKRWLNSDYAPYMNNWVQAFNGTNWITVWESVALPGVQDSSWTTQTYDMTPYLNPQFKIQFVYVRDSFAFNVSSWNIDNVQITGSFPWGVAYTGAPCGAPAPLLYSAPPAIGTLWNATVFGGAPLTPGFLIFGTPTTPIDIVGSFCTLDLAPSFMIFMATDAAGSFTFPAAIPNDELLLGLTVWAQAILIGPGGVSTTNVAGMTFGTL